MFDTIIVLIALYLFSKTGLLKEIILFYSLVAIVIGFGLLGLLINKKLMKEINANKN